MAHEERPNSAAAIFSAICFPGLGFLYLGRPLHALFVSIFPFIALFVFSVSIQKWYWGFIFSLAFMAVWQLCQIIATLVYLKRYGKREYSWFYSGTFTIALGIVLSFAIEPAFLPIYSKIARYRPFSIPGASMEPSIHEGDRLVVDTSWFKQHSIRLGDIVAYESREDSRVLYIKRVVGIGGDTIEMRGGQLFRNGKIEVSGKIPKISSDYIDYQNDQYHQYSMLPTPVPTGYVFCVGDNRAQSLDSRNHGPVSIDNIHGKVIYTWWPLKNVRSSYD